MAILNLTLAFRNLRRNKAFSVINIAGLALGMACSLLIFLWVQDERRMDNFHEHAKDLYDVYERVFPAGKVEGAYWTPGLLARELKRKIPEIRYSSAFWNRGDDALFGVGEKNMSMRGAYADSDFLRIFSYPLLEGRAGAALAGRDDIAISRRMADNFFGSPAAAFGKSIRYDDVRSFRVSAVFDDVPANSSEKFDYLLNWDFALDTIGWLKDWINRSPATFIQLEPNADPARVEAKIKGFIMPYLGHYGAGYHLELGLQPYDQKYLNATFRDGRPGGGRIEYVRLFSIVAVFILLIACINFMNLATARSIRRAKEVGIRKTVGAPRWALIGQFIGEAMLITFFAGLLALVLAAPALPAFGRLTGKQLVFPWASTAFWLDVLGLLLCTGFIAGSYPALFLSSLQPIKVLNGRLRFSAGALFFRKGLVVFQFVLSIVFIVATIVVARQVDYVQTRNLGFDRENLVYIPYQGDLGGRFDLFRQLLTGMPGIGAVTTTTNAPSHIGTHVYDLSWEGKDPNTRVVGFHNGVGYDYLKMMDIKLLQGRNFSRDFPADTSGTNLIINETLLKLTGYRQPIGTWLNYFEQRCTIVGVIRDFNIASLHDPMQPLVLYWGEHARWGGVLVKTQAGQTRQAVTSVQQVFRQLEPKFPFKYSFADEEYQRLYDSEQTTSRLSGVFSFLAIAISCLGLLGLVLFTAEQRTREIGARKVIGARSSDILILLTGEMLRLVVLSTLIATPVAWLAMDRWLRDFAYRIPISWWIFPEAGVMAVLIAIVTISFQTLKAALANPVSALRSE